MPLSLASIRHMGFCPDPRAPVPATLGLFATSKPFRPQRAMQIRMSMTTLQSVQPFHRYHVSATMFTLGTSARALATARVVDGRGVVCVDETHVVFDANSTSDRLRVLDDEGFRT